MLGERRVVELVAEEDAHDARRVVADAAREPLVGADVAPEHLREAAAVRVLGLDERAVKVEKGAAQGRSRRRQGGRGSESQGGGD